MIVALALALVAAAPSQEYRLTTGSGIRARKEPKSSAAEVVRLPIGTLLAVKERSPKQDTIDGKTDHWLHVDLPKGSGWIFGGFTRAVDPAHAPEAYLELWRERSKVETTQFAERADLAELLTRAEAEATAKELGAELALASWRATKWTLSAISFEQQEQDPYRGWIKKQGDRLVYSEPAGQWFMNARVAWDLEEKYRGLTPTDDLAWEAASTPLPGECEGYVPCYLSIVSTCEGHYLDTYPNGKHVDEAMTALVEGVTIQSDLLTSLGDEEKKDIREAIGRIEQTLAKVDAKRTAPAMKPLATLKQVATGSGRATPR